MNVIAVATSQNVTIALLALAACMWPASALPVGRGDDAGHGDLAVSPAVIEWALPDGGRSNVAVRVANLGAETLHVDARVAGWTFAGDGGVQVLPPDPAALSGRLVVNPARTQIPPGERRTLRLWLAEPEALPRGEHRALLRLRASGASDVRTDVDLAVYAYRGALEVRADLRRAWWRRCDGRIEAGFEIVNAGERHVRLDGWLAIAAADGAVHREPLPRTPVLPGTVRTLSMQLPWPGAAPLRVEAEGQLGTRDLREWFPGQWPSLGCGSR